MDSGSIDYVWNRNDALSSTDISGRPPLVFIFTKYVQNVSPFERQVFRISAWKVEASNHFLEPIQSFDWSSKSSCVQKSSFVVVKQSRDVRKQLVSNPEADLFVWLL